MTVKDETKEDSITLLTKAMQLLSLEIKKIPLLERRIDELEEILQEKEIIENIS